MFPPVRCLGATGAMTRRRCLARADQIGQQRPTARQASLDRADRYAQRLGHFVDRHVGEVVQHDGLAGRPGQLLQCGDEQDPIGCCAGYGFRGDLDPAGADHRVQESAPAPAGPGEVDGDRTQPGLRVGHVQEHLRPGERPRVRLLHEILRLGVVGGEPVERRDQAAVVGLVRSAYRLSRLKIVTHAAPARRIVEPVFVCLS